MCQILIYLKVSQSHEKGVKELFFTYMLQYIHQIDHGFENFSYNKYIFL